MDKRLDFTGGNPDIRIDQILIDSEANRPALHAILKPYAIGTNPNFIISGCELTITVTGNPLDNYEITSGYIYLNDEILQVDTQSGTFARNSDSLAYSKNISYNAKGDITYIDATPRQTWQENRGVVTVQSSVSATELDARYGDHLDDKIKEYIGLDDLIQTTILDIGSWDMNTISSVNIAHGLIFSKIRTVEAYIYNDALTSYEQLVGANETESGGTASVDSTNILLRRLVSGRFDNSLYNETGINRGYIIIKWLP